MKASNCWAARAARGSSRCVWALVGLWAIAALAALPAVAGIVHYRDADGDSYGDPASTVVAPSPPAGYVANAQDCDDTAVGVHPGATEVCNGDDDDCNGTTDLASCFWVRVSTGPGLHDLAPDVAVDSAGGLVVLGLFAGATGQTTNFGSGDPPDSTLELTSQGFKNGFLARYDRDGLLTWLRHSGTSHAYAVQPMADGGVFVHAHQSGATVFNYDRPDQTLPYPLSIGTTCEGYLARYEADGRFGWVQPYWGNYRATLGSLPSFSDPTEGIDCDTTRCDYRYDLAAMPGGGMVLGGNFERAGEIATEHDMQLFLGKRNGALPDPVDSEWCGGSYLCGHETDVAAGSGSGVANEVDGFVARIADDGGMIWHRQIVGPYSDDVTGLAVAPDGTVYATGYFSGTDVNFDPPAACPSSACLSSAGPGVVDAFLASYTPAGVLSWVQRIGGPGAHVLADRGIDVEALTDGSAVVTGIISGTAAFDLLPEVEAEGDTDAFLARFDSSGNALWVRLVGGSGVDRGMALADLGGGVIAMTGSFSATATFGRGLPGEMRLTSRGGEDVFLCAFESDGDFLWARSAGSEGDDEGLSIAAMDDGRIAVSGFFSSTAEFPLWGATPRSVTSGGLYDSFLALFPDSPCAGAVSGCDDGNGVSGDGCDSNCTATACGNGIVTADEQCDDGNTDNGDGCSSACLSEPCIEPPVDLIAWWSADGTTNDVSGSGHHGTFQPADAYATGKVLEAFDLSASGDCVVVPDHADFALGTADFTISLWARFEPSAGTYQVFLAQNVATNPKWQLYDNNGSLTFLINPGFDPDIELFGHQPWTREAGHWYHIAVTRNGAAGPNNWHLYVDGDEVDTDSSAEAVPDVAASLTIGCITVDAFDGQIDEVMIAGSALSEAEFQAIYQLGATGHCKSCAMAGVPAGAACSGDGNPCTLDECSAGACSHAAGNAGVACRAAADVCDLAEVCDGASTACPADAAEPDTDGDGACDEIDVCANGVELALAKLTISRLTVPAGEQRLSLKGEMTLPHPFSPALDPLGKGARVVLTDVAGGEVADVTIACGAYDSMTRTGWKVNSSGTAWKYMNRDGYEGITGVQIKDNSSRTPGLVSVKVRGKGDFTVAAANLPVRATIILDLPLGDSGQCAEQGFPGPDPLPECALSASQSTVRCQ